MAEARNDRPWPPPEWYLLTEEQRRDMSAIIHLFAEGDELSAMRKIREILPAGWKLRDVFRPRPR